MFPGWSRPVSDDGLPQHFLVDGEDPREEFNFLLLVMFPVQRHSGPAFAGVSQFPLLDGIGAAASGYVAYAVHSVRGPTAGRLASVTRPEALHWHVQEYLEGLDYMWEELRLALGVPNASHAGAMLPPFPAAGAMPPEKAALLPESDLRVRGPVGPGDAACRATKNLQTARHHRDVQESPWHNQAPLRQHLE